MLNFVNWFKFPTIQYKNLLIMVLIAILMTLHPIECHIEMLPWRLVVKLLTSPMFLLLGKWLQWCLWYTSSESTRYVAVPGRNSTLFRRVFRSHGCVQSAVTQYFRYGWGSYALCKLMNTWYIYTAHISPTLSGSSALHRFEHVDAIKFMQQNNVQFLPRTATYVVQIFVKLWRERKRRTQDLPN